MKFASILATAVTLASAVTATPVILDRQTTPVQAISNSLAILQASTNQSTTAIGSAVANAKSNVGAAVSIAAAINANLQAIANGFATAAASITTAIGQAGNGVAGQVQALSQAEVDALSADLTTLQQILSGIGATVTLEATNLGPAAQAAVAAETAVVLNAVAPVVNPLMAFASAASKASASVGATVTGLQGAYTGVQTIVQRLVSANGLPGISFPGSS